MSEAAYAKLVEKRRTEAFLALSRDPGNWLERALRHRRAADIIFDVGCRAWDRGMTRLINQIEERLPGTTSHVLEGEELEDFRDEQMISEYLLLSGYALECLLKGCLLAKRPELVSKRLDKQIAKHDLIELCDDCGLALTDEESSLMALITRHVSWGKYTTPLHEAQMPSGLVPEDDAEKSLAIGNPYYQGGAKIIVDAVYDRAHQLLQSEWLKATGAGR
jgi:hypothetical protein